MSVSVRRQHQVMEDAIRAIMGAGTPPTMSVGSTYASIVFPQGYTVPNETTLTNKYNELIALEADRGFMHVSGDMVVASNFTVSGNTTVSSNLSVSGNTTVSSNLTVSGNVEVGTANLFVDTLTGRVGVGTTSPQEKIHIYGAHMVQHDTTYQQASGATGWYKLGVWKGSDSTGQGANLKLTLLGGSGYNAISNNKSGETVIHAKLLNNFDTNVANIGGLFHSVGNPVVYKVKFKQVGSNRHEYEVHAETPQYTQHNMSIECSITTSFTRDFTASSDPGADSATVREAKFTHVINESGNVGIGITNPSYKLHVSGDVYATGNVTGYSDKRAKEDIKKIENALEKIEQLNGYTYTMNDKRYTGLIAQEVLPVLPEAVTGSEDTNYALAYGNMMGLIVEAIKELKQKIDK